MSVPPIVVVLYPSLGSLLAITALSRCFPTPPRVYFFDELHSEMLSKDTEVVVLDYLLAQANHSPVPAILDCVHRVQTLGGQVLELPRKNTSYGFSPGMNAMLSDIFRENRRREDLHGYDYVLARLPWAQEALDSVGQQLLADANAVDICNECPSVGVVEYDAFCNSLDEPECFRQAVASILTHCNSSLLS